MEIFLTATNLLLISGLLYLFFKEKNRTKEPKVTTWSDITKLKSIGELSVFKIYSKEIVTKKDDAINGFWNNIFGWSMTKKSIAIIFEFEIDFTYDLLDSRFLITPLNNENYEIKMPPCKYKYSIKDMKIYDEKNAKLLPFLLPDSLNGIFGASFDENDKNRLIDEAKQEVKNLSSKIIDDLGGKIHKSATDTLSAIAKSFGAKEVFFEFHDENIKNIDIKKSEILLDNSLKEQISHQKITID